MFERAIAEAMRYTMPVVGLRRKPDGTVVSTLGAFIVLNSTGWALTAAHILAESVQAQRAVSRGDLTHAADLWAFPGFDRLQPRVAEIHVDEPADLALVRLEPFSASEAIRYPRLRPNRDGLQAGSSVCKLGFPFHAVQATFDEAKDAFDVTSGFPVPAFALDGMISRFEARADGERHVLSLQMSTPGLRGQSGGPILDVDGHLVGLQSRTVHLDLGFDATYLRDGEQVVERQFINVGVATHVDEIRRLLSEWSVTCGK